MKVTMLGVWGAYPSANSSTSSFLLEQDGYSLLVDCGSGVLSQLQRYLPIEKLDALLLSHFHHDHVADVGCLQYSVLIQKDLGNRQGVFPIYAPSTDEAAFQALSKNGYTKANSIDEHSRLAIGPYEITFCRTEHPAYCLAMRVSANGKELVYTADTEWFDSLVDFSSGADLLISECSLYNEQLGKIKGHLTAGEVGQLAKMAGVSRLLLTHLPHYGDHELLIEQASEYYKGSITIPKAGQTFQV